MKKKTILVLLILTLSIYAFNINVQSAVEENDYRPTSLELTPHDPIEITSDSDFEVFPGNRTAEDPYVIEGYNITTTSSYGIYISSITKYFRISDCYINAVDYGIYIYNIADGTGTISNNTCENNDWYGILLGFSSNSTITNNICSNNNWNGIEISSSRSSNVTNNTCNNNNNYGIALYSSGSSIIANNTCSNNNDWGIYLYSSGSSTVANNTCNNNYIGIEFDSSRSSTVANNTLTNCGLYIYENTIDAYISYTLENNWVNSKKLGFFTNLDSTTISEPVYGQLILVNCTNVIVRDQILNYAVVGLFLYSCTSSVITNNTCISNNWRGIFLSSSGRSTVINNTCNNGSGILLLSSGSSTVTNNTCTNNFGIGIYLKFSGSSNVTNNTCGNNNIYGIELWSSGSSNVVNNNCSNNNIYGIYFGRSDSCVVTYNHLQENEDYGVYLRYDSDNNLIHHNTFVDNNLGGTSQAFDNCTNNFWYYSTTLEGNYWDDWTGIGSYSIDGSAGSVDLYPLDEPVVVEYPQVVLLTLLLSIVTLLFTRTISRR